MLNIILRNRLMTAAFIVFAIGSVSIISALVFEHVLGFQPCELCYLQRKPWYFIISFTLLLLLLGSKGNDRLVRWGLFLAGTVLVGEAALAFWHAGIEWKWWPGPSSCTGAVNMTGALPDLSKRVVLCDEAAVRILGLSFAGWNAVVSLITAIIAFWGAAGRTDGE